MNSETVGIASSSPEAYDIDDVQWAMRVTYSGEFIHAAPWSVGSQGYANVSHGCTGMSTDERRLALRHEPRGDVVEYTGTDRPMTLDNGYGDWNVAFADYQGGSRPQLSPSAPSPSVDRRLPGGPSRRPADVVARSSRAQPGLALHRRWIAPSGDFDRDRRTRSAVACGVLGGARAAFDARGLRPHVDALRGCDERPRRCTARPWTHRW